MVVRGRTTYDERSTTQAVLFSETQSVAQLPHVIVVSFVNAAGQFHVFVPLESDHQGSLLGRGHSGGGLLVELVVLLPDVAAQQGSVGGQTLADDLGEGPVVVGEQIVDLFEDGTPKRSLSVSSWPQSTSVQTRSKRVENVPDS
jgi:hypothetical protein